MVAVLPEEEEFNVIADCGFQIADLNTPKSTIRNPKYKIVIKVSNHYTQWQDILAQKQELQENSGNQFSVRQAPGKEKFSTRAAWNEQEEKKDLRIWCSAQGKAESKIYLWNA